MYFLVVKAKWKSQHDILVFLVMTGNAHQESCLKLSLILILVREKEFYVIKTDCSGEMVVAFTIKEKTLFDGKPILPIGAAPFLFMFVVLSSFGCTIGLVSGIAPKAAVASQQLFTMF